MNTNRRGFIKGSLGVLAATLLPNAQAQTGELKNYIQGRTDIVHAPPEGGHSQHSPYRITLVGDGKNSEDITNQFSDYFINNTDFQVIKNSQSHTKAGDEIASYFLSRNNNPDLSAGGVSSPIYIAEISTIPNQSRDGYIDRHAVYMNVIDPQKGVVVYSGKIPGSGKENVELLQQDIFRLVNSEQIVTDSPIIKNMYITGDKSLERSISEYESRQDKKSPTLRFGIRQLDKPSDDINLAYSDTLSYLVNDESLQGNVDVLAGHRTIENIAEKLGLDFKGRIVGDYEAELKIKDMTHSGDNHNQSVYRYLLEVIKTENDQVILGNSMNIASPYSKGYYSELTTGLRNKLGLLKEVN